MGTRIAFAAASLAALFAAEDSAAQLYVKLDSGYSWASSAKLKDDQPTSPDCVLQPASGSTCNGALNELKSSFIIGAGVGYRFPCGFRADVTYGYRGGYDLSGCDAAGSCFDPKVDSNALMLNGYYELPASLADGRVKPFVGGGIGASRNQMNNLQWQDSGQSGTLPGGKTTQFAWQLTLGADVRLAGAWVLEVGYRYSDFGKFIKAAGPGSGAPFNANNFTTQLTGKLRANELILNVRYDFPR